MGLGDFGLFTFTGEDATGVGLGVGVGVAVGVGVDAGVGVGVDVCVGVVDEPVAGAPGFPISSAAVAAVPKTATEPQSLAYSGRSASDD